LTPPAIIVVALSLWPEGIALDPCTAPGSIVPAIRAYTVEDDGLSKPWLPRTYINPPYNDLKRWLAYGLTQPMEQLWLVPVRTHRPWFRHFLAQSTLICWLDSGLTFLGYNQPFPAPLALVYRGYRKDKFISSTSLLGDTTCWKGGHEC
jgi:hypothetical protein